MLINSFLNEKLSLAKFNPQELARMYREANDKVHSFLGQHLEDIYPADNNPVTITHDFEELAILDASEG
ncbi:MAG: hypothetical protein ACFFD4_35645 [Candidatus Odinarchaeota archaeon]